MTHCQITHFSCESFPTKGGIQSIEMVQRQFLRKISGMQNISYWQQLKQLRLYSLERRRERYRIIYVWRILEGQVPNLSTDGQTPKITAKWHPRRGRECIIPTVTKTAPPAVKSLVYASLPVHGQQLFNSLPIDVRNVTQCSVDCFKRKLDKYLWTVPDEPQIPGYTAQRKADSNSLVDMSRYVSSHHELVVEVTGGSLTPGNRGCANSIAMVH